MSGAADRRPERAGDGAFLFALFAAAQGDTLAGFDPKLREMLLRQGFAGQAATYRVAHPAARFDIVEEDGASAGRLVTVLSVEALVLLDVAVHPERRGRGLGTRLLRDLQAEARAAGVPLRLSVLRSNAGARRLYMRLGFVPAGDTDTHIHMRWTS